MRIRAAVITRKTLHFFYQDKMHSEMLLVAATILAVLTGPGLSINPGFRVAFTAKGLDYGRQVGITILEASLHDLKIPDLTGKQKIDFGIGHITFTWTVSNVQIQSLVIPTSSLSPGSNGLTLKASGISSKTGGHINVNDGHDTPHISASTDLDITFSGVAFSVSILFGNDSSGRATAKSSGCSASVGDAHVNFHGGSSWIYKVVDHIADFGGMLKRNFAPTFCDGVSDAINKQLNHAIESQPVVIKVDKWAEVNYALTQSPVYTNDSMATLHKGEFEALSHPTEAPFSPPPLPPITDTAKMMYIWLSEYVVNTAGLVYHETGFLAYNITPDMVPKDVPIKLNTSSFRKLIPALYSKYPNMGMLLTVKTTKPPQMQIYPKSANLTAIGEVNVQVITPNNTVPQSAFIMGLTVYMNAYAWVHPNGTKEQVISANITLLKFTFDVISSNIGDISLAELNQAVQLLVNLAVIPLANVYGQKGLEIPLVDGLSFVNPSVSFGEGYVLISSDAHYNPTIIY